MRVLIVLFIILYSAIGFLLARKEINELYPENQCGYARNNPIGYTIYMLFIWPWQFFNMDMKIAKLRIKVMKNKEKE